MLQKRFTGFLNTPFLWKRDMVSNLNHFEIDSKSNKINIIIDEKLRLGKYIERFVSFELGQHEHISILAENIQVQQGKQTLGELDCLLLKDHQAIHLEIIYKFYLYDTSVGTTEIEHFIGPNRKDSLIEKISKLKDKQLPLLHTNGCKSYLEAFNLTSENILQQVYFKAQLFVPYSNQDVQLKTLNTDCIIGFYINKHQLDLFRNCKFYIPTKKDWLVIPHTNVTWLNFIEFEVIAKAYFEQQFSSLVWVKLKSGVLKKLFLVWW